jgi:hypothetical protein
VVINNRSELSPNGPSIMSQIVKFILKILRALERFFLALDLRLLRTQISNGGDSDLYRGIRALDPRVPLRPEIQAILMWTAETICTLFPGRVPEPLRHATDASIIVMQFCDDVRTTREDILCVLDHDL